MSKYLAKGKYPNYKNTIEKIHISEMEILAHFMLSIQLIIFPLLVENDKAFLKYFKKRENIEVETLKKSINKSYYEIWLLFFSTTEETALIPFESLTKELQVILSNDGMNKEKYSDDDIVKIWREFEQSLINSGYLLAHEDIEVIEDTDNIFNKEVSETRALMDKNTYLLLANKIKESPLLTINADKEKKEVHIKMLAKQKEEIEQEKKNYRRNALKMGYSKEEITETTKDMENSIKLIEEQINEFSENTEMERYLERLPEILLKTFELGSNAIQRAKVGDIKEDIFKLLEITTFELTINSKKELEIKLFEALDKLLNDWIDWMEAPPGVEPGYKALQASA